MAPISVDYGLGLWPPPHTHSLGGEGSFASLWRVPLSPTGKPEPATSAFSVKLEVSNALEAPRSQGAP